MNNLYTEEKRKFQNIFKALYMFNVPKVSCTTNIYVISKLVPLTSYSTVAMSHTTDSETKWQPIAVRSLPAASETITVHSVTRVISVIRQKAMHSMKADTLK